MDVFLQDSEEYKYAKTAPFPLLRLVVFVISLSLLASATLLGYLNTASSAFPLNTDVVIQSGTSISTVADLFARTSVVRSSFLLSSTLHYYFPNSYIQAGVYRFDHPLTTYEIASAITHGMNKTPLIKVTFPEGFRVSEMKRYLPDTLSTVDLHGAEAQQGFLFPDTYYIDEHLAFTDLLSLMEQNFKDRTKPFAPLLASSTLSLHEVITLASIVEREARDESSMKIVAGILLKRLAINMPLQVDATFEYLLGKTSAELSATDLATDSPYNTYRNKGLPPEPISNPGLTAIEAVLQPTHTEYLYYLTDKDGMFHYARTFEEHKINKAKFL